MSENSRDFNRKSRPISIGGDFTIDAHIFNAVGESVVAEARKAYNASPGALGKGRALTILCEAMMVKIFEAIFSGEARDRGK